MPSSAAAAPKRYSGAAQAAHNLVALDGLHAGEIVARVFRDDEAGGEHVRTDHFKKATAELPAYLTRTPDIINVTVEGWSALGELAVK